MPLNRSDESLIALLSATRLAALRATGLLDQPPDPSLDRFTRLAARLIGAPVSLLSLVDENRQFFASAFGLAEPWATQRETPLSHSFCQHVVLEDAPLVVDDAREHPVLSTNLAIPDLGVVAYAGVPLRGPKGDVLGAFCVIDDAPRKWTAEDLEILRDFADAVTAEFRLRALAGRAEAIIEGLPVVTFDLEPESGRLVAVEGAVESLFGTDADTLLASPGLWDELVDAEDQPAVAAARTKAAKGGTGSVSYRLRPRAGWWLWVQETVRGRVAANGRTVAVHGAIVDVSPQHQLAQRLDAQNRVAFALASATEVTGAASDLLRQLGESLSWEVGAFWLADDGARSLRCVAQWSHPDRPAPVFTEMTRTIRFAKGEGLPGTCWARGEPVWTRDVWRETNFPRRDAARADNLHGALAFPVLRSGATAAVVEFFSREMREPDAGLLDVARAIGSQIGQFLDRLESERELRESREYYRRVARTFQRSLVPAEPPAVEGFEVAVRFHPASHSEVVGGDFFDVFRLGHGGWAISIGDVCGKGTTAAAVTSLVRHALRGAALTGAPPDAALETANQALLNEDLQERFCSAMLAALSPAEGCSPAEIALANAGHPCAFVVRRDGTVETSGKPGLVLGAFAPVSAETERILLEPGDALVLYTDGYTEARSGGAQFGEEQLAELLRVHAGESAQELAAAVDETVEAFSDGRRRDDQALVVVRAALRGQGR